MIRQKRTRNDGVTRALMHMDCGLLRHPHKYEKKLVAHQVPYMQCSLCQNRFGIERRTRQHERKSMLRVNGWSESDADKCSDLVLMRGVQKCALIPEIIASPVRTDSPIKDASTATNINRFPDSRLDANPTRLLGPYSAQCESFNDVAGGPAAWQALSVQGWP